MVELCTVTGHINVYAEQGGARMSEQDENEEELQNRRAGLAENAEVQQAQLGERLSLMNSNRASAKKKKGFLTAFSDNFGKMEEADNANAENNEIEMIGAYLLSFVLQTTETT